MTTTLVAICPALLFYRGKRRKEPIEPASQLCFHFQTRVVVIIRVVPMAGKRIVALFIISSGPGMPIVPVTMGILRFLKAGNAHCNAL